MSGQAPARIFNQRLAGREAKLPETIIGDAAKVRLQIIRRSQPAIFSTGFGPEIVRFRRVPSRNVNSIGHMTDRHFILRPMRKERLEQMPADLAMQAAHAIHRTAAANGQICHIETLRQVIWILTA